MENFGGSIREEPGFSERNDINGIIEDKILKNRRFVKGSGRGRYRTGIEGGEKDGSQSWGARIRLDIA